jgi:hypothetical protein
VERIASVKKQAESEFKKMFYVSKSEAAEIREIAKLAGQNFDLSALPAEKAKRLDELYTSINNRVGFSVPTEASILSAKGTVLDNASLKSTSFIDSAEKQVEGIVDRIKHERLRAFISAF